MVDPKNKTLDQRRAEHAWNAVLGVVKNVGKERAKTFGGHAKKLPTRIIASGLGQALAFVRAKDPNSDLLAALNDWVLVKSPLAKSKHPKPTDGTLLRAIVERDSDFLRRATDEVLAYLNWLNRFAEAEKITEGVEV